MKLFSFFLPLLFFLGCNGGVNDRQLSPVIRENTTAGVTGDTYSYEEEFTKEKTTETASEKPEQKIIKTATLRFETKDINQTRLKILALTKELNGFIQNDYSGKGYNELTQNIVIRIPTANFQPFLDNLSKEVSYFDEKTISRQDVTEEFVDIEARLKAKKELENRYLELLKKAKNVSEILEIERELASIREEIEAKEGRLKYLSSRVSLSTISVAFYKITDVKSASTSYWQKMKNSFSGGWNGVSVFFLGLLYLWPFFVIVGIVIFIIRRILKKRKK